MSLGRRSAGGPPHTIAGNDASPMPTNLAPSPLKTDQESARLLTGLGLSDLDLHDLNRACIVDEIQTVEHAAERRDPG